MPRGDTGGGGGTERSNNSRNNAQGGSDWRGDYKWQKSGRGKNAERRKVYAKAANPNYGKKTKGFSYKGERSEKEPYRAGANILDKKGKVAGRMSFDKHLKSTGNRADDPRNWEFHYEKPARGGFYLQGKNDNRRSYTADARRRAETKAKRTGKEVYEVQKIEYQTQGIVQGTEEAGAQAKAKGGAGAFGSTRVATGVAAQRQKAQRRTGRSGPQRGAIA